MKTWEMMKFLTEDQGLKARLKGYGDEVSVNEDRMLVYPDGEFAVLDIEDEWEILPKINYVSLDAGILNAYYFENRVICCVMDDDTVTYEFYIQNNERRLDDLSRDMILYGKWYIK